MSLPKCGKYHHICGKIYIKHRSLVLMRKLAPSCMSSLTSGSIGCIAPNQVIARSEFEVQRQIYTE